MEGQLKLRLLSVLFLVVSLGFTLQTVSASTEDYDAAVLEEPYLMDGDVQEDVDGFAEDDAQEGFDGFVEGEYLEGDEGFAEDDAQDGFDGFVEGEFQEDVEGFGEGEIQEGVEGFIEIEESSAGDENR